MLPRAEYCTKTYNGSEEERFLAVITNDKLSKAEVLYKENCV